MPLHTSFQKRVFQFGFKARTSRGLMRDKTSWFIKIWNDAHPEIVGLGECGPLPGLSADASPDFEDQLKDVLQKIQGQSALSEQDLKGLVPPGFSSLLFGLETALLDLQHGGKRLIFDSDFSTGGTIPINGLIWMGDLDFTMSQINTKIAQGFRCIKLKVGGLDFDKECDVLQYIRKRYFRENIEIRLDANGAMKADDVMYKLTELAKFKIDSIEQPLKPGHELLEELCRKTPIPIALDEELIGIELKEDKQKLLERVKPQFIILKPTLHGGFSGSSEWISIAESLGIGWWITSALESNIGLNAICQFARTYPISIPQGLGTGAIYENNIPSPLHVEKGFISLKNSLEWDVSSL